MDWDSLGPFIFFIIWMAASILKASKKKKQQRRPPAGEDLVIFEQQTEPKQPPIITAPMPQQEQPAEQHRTLDYMMAKPKEDRRDEAQVYRESEPQRTAAAEEIPDSAADVLAQVQDDYKNYLAQQRFAAEVKADAPEKELDYIQRTEIASEQAAGLRISIERQQITQAITYAQVLEQPKSLQYLRRFGIRRVIHKD